MIKKLFLVALMLLSVYIAKAQDNTQLALSNFRIENSNTNRVYFDVKNGTDISNLTRQGFIISGKSISSVDTSGNFFTVSSPFTFWDNNTIRLENGDGNVKDFTLTYITNNITEPEASTNRFVSVTGAGAHDGTSEANAWTFQEAATNAVAGQTVWVKSGNYNLQEIGFVNKNGTITSPIKFIGYTSTINDLFYDSITTNFQYVSTASANEFIDDAKYPVLRGNNSSKAGAYGGSYMNGFWIENSDFIIFKNIQIEKYYNGVWAYQACDGLVFQNMTFANAGREQNYNEGDNFLVGATSNGRRIRFIDNVSFDAIAANYRSYSSNSLVKDSKFYAGIIGQWTSTPYDQRSTDYYISLFGGSNSIVTGNYVERVFNLVHGGHGAGVRSESNSEYNLFSYNDIRHTTETYMAGGPNTHHNVFKHNYTKGGAGRRAYGVQFRDGAHDNIFENNYCEVVNYCIYSWFTTEYSSDDISVNNTYRNNIFNDFLYGVVTTNAAGTGTKNFTNAKIYNNTFYGGASAKDFFWNSANPASADIVFSGCEFKNNIVTDVNKDYKGFALVTDYTMTYNNWFNIGFIKPAGTGNISIDPQFEDLVDFVPQNAALRAGIPITGVEYGIYGNERDKTNPMIGAVEKKNDSNSNAITASAGSDISICDGESTTLTASGGTTYLWNNGETTASITVSPSETTTYTVTAFDGTESDIDSVVVTVNKAPSVSAGSDISICSGENITLTATGIGNFLWSTGETTSSITVSPIATTTYTVTASNLCADDATDQVIVSINPGVTLDAGNDREICLGETITLTAQSNGAVLWSTGETTASIAVNPTVTSTYTLTSTLGDCSKTDQVLVTVNEAPSVSAGSDISICSGENITLTATGIGNILWSTGETTSSITVSPIATTTYTVTASNSCADDATDQVIVTVNDKPTVSVSNDITIENGSSTVLTASGDGNFLWSTGETTSSITVSPSITTTYSVTLTSQQGCSETNSIEVTVTNNSESTVTADAGPDQDVCMDASVELTASGGDSYLWSTGETTPSITVSPTETTTYTVTVSNGNSIDVDDITVYIDENCSDIANRPIIQEFKVYPNPTNGILHIELSGYSNELNLSLYNATGKIIHSDIISNYSLDKSLKRNINLRKYGKGVYYARIVNNGKNETKKVIVM